jgi:addiction module RelE/StbE family toxin
MDSEGYKIVVTQHALLDIEEITAYLAVTLQNKKAAKDWMNELRKQFKALVEQPYLHPKSRIEELSMRGYRCFLIKHYLVFYLVEESIQSVIIARVIYGSRDYTGLVLS